MAEQIFFILSVYLIGSIFSFCLFKGIPPLIRNSIAPILGLSYLSFSVGFLIIFNYRITLLAIYSVISIVVAIQLFYNYSKYSNDSDINYYKLFSIY